MFNKYRLCLYPMTFKYNPTAKLQSKTGNTYARLCMISARIGERIS